MKVLKKLGVAAGLATAVLAGAAQAATISTPSTAAVPAYGLTIVNEASRAIITPAATVVTLGATEALNIDDSITFTLSQGTWASIAVANLTAAPNVNGAGFALVSGGTGQNFATFRVTSANTDLGAVLTLAALATVNGAAVPDNGTINITAEMKGFVGGVATDLFGSPLVSLAVQLVPMMTTTITGTTTGTFDVATGFTQLTAGTSASGAAPFILSTAGAAATVTASTASAANTTTAGVPAANPTPGLTLVKISGPMTGVTSITETVTAQITSATCTGAVPALGTVANAFDLDTTNDEACAVFTAGNNAPGVADALAFLWTFNSAVTHDISAYSLAVTRLADGSFAATTAGGGDIASFGRNGSSFTTNSFGPLNKITVTDRSGALGAAGSADGAIALSVWDSSGNPVTCTGLSIANLASNSTVTIQGSDVLAACPGMKRIDGNVNSNSILVTNVKLDPNTGATATPAIATGGGTAAQ